ncbi:MAG: P-loop NTPase fold protein [Anaerolineales bacterium]
MIATVHEPITEWRKDLLGRIAYVDQFLGRLSQADCSQVIGVYGGWGTGKTSFLKMAEDRYPEWRQSHNASGPKFSFQFVDAWLYEQTQNLATPILAVCKK